MNTAFAGIFLTMLGFIGVGAGMAAVTVARVPVLWAIPCSLFLFLPSCLAGACFMFWLLGK